LEITKGEKWMKKMKDLIVFFLFISEMDEEEE
jgi:hypothetical protein